MFSHNRFRHLCKNLRLFFHAFKPVLFNARNENMGRRRRRRWLDQTEIEPRHSGSVIAFKSLDLN